MKSFNIAMLISVIFTLPVQAQNKTMAERSHALIGPVRTVRTETADVLEKDGRYVDGPRVLSATMSFNEDGNRTELGLYDEKGLLKRRIVIRFEGKKEVEFLNYDGAGKMWLRGLFHHDAEGRVRESATYNGDGSLRSRTIVKRNERGQLLESVTSDAKGTVIEKSGSTFNDAGDLKTVERISNRADGSLSRRELHNLTTKQSETITYDKDGAVLGKSIRVNQEITDYAGDGSLKKSTFITNVGRLPEELTYNPDGNTRKESIVPDEIDAHGNWVKQTQWVSDVKGNRPVKVTYRVITYY